jgi:hypothetical protein
MLRFRRIDIPAETQSLKRSRDVTRSRQLRIHTLLQDVLQTDQFIRYYGERYSVSRVFLVLHNLL